MKRGWRRKEYVCQISLNYNALNKHFNKRCMTSLDTNEE